jgi:hypothetical protein
MPFSPQHTIEALRQIIRSLDIGGHCQYSTL